MSIYVCTTENTKEGEMAVYRQDPNGHLEKPLGVIRAENDVIVFEPNPDAAYLTLAETRALCLYLSGMPAARVTKSLKEADDILRRAMAAYDNDPDRLNTLFLTLRPLMAKGLRASQSYPEL